MLVLALDTSTPVTTVAVARLALADLPAGTTVGFAGRRTTVLSQHTEPAPNRHGEVLAPLIGRALEDAGADRRDVGLVAVGVGPGPYTGLRTGLMTAVAFADALSLPVVGVCSLDVVAHADERPWPDGFAVVTDARRREVYWALYRDGHRVTDPAVATPAEVAGRLPGGCTVVGAGGVLYADAFDGHPVDPRSPQPCAGDLAELAVDAQWRCPVEPMYLRRPDARPPGAPKKVTPV